MYKIITITVQLYQYEEQLDKIIFAGNLWYNILKFFLACIVECSDITNSVVNEGDLARDSVHYYKYYSDQ